MNNNIYSLRLDCIRAHSFPDIMHIRFHINVPGTWYPDIPGRRLCKGHQWEGMCLDP
jgi:hypothetical protein